MSITQVLVQKFDKIINNRFYVDPKFLKPWKCPSILIVDDQFINRYIIEQYCAKYQVPCSTAEDGLEAVKQVKEAAIKDWWEGFHLILMDLNMPHLGGIEATKLILESQSRFEASQDLAIIGNIMPYLTFYSCYCLCIGNWKAKMTWCWNEEVHPKTIPIARFCQTDINIEL